MFSVFFTYFYLLFSRLEQKSGSVRGLLIKSNLDWTRQFRLLAIMAAANLKTEMTPSCHVFPDRDWV